MLCKLRNYAGSSLLNGMEVQIEEYMEKLG